MKKIVFFAIVIIYIASIVVVNFFGLQIAIFEGTVYVNEIKLEVSDEYGDTIPLKKHDTEENTDHYYITFVQPVGEEYTFDNRDTNPNVIVLIPHVYPENADNKEFDYVYERNDEYYYVDEEKNTVIFFKQLKALDITIKARDGHNAQTKIHLLATPSK